MKVLKSSWKSLKVLESPWKSLKVLKVLHSPCPCHCHPVENVIFDILTLSAFWKYCLCWVFSEYFISEYLNRSIQNGGTISSWFCYVDCERIWPNDFFSCLIRILHTHTGIPFIGEQKNLDYTLPGHCTVNNFSSYLHSWPIEILCY